MSRAAFHDGFRKIEILGRIMREQTVAEIANGFTVDLAFRISRKYKISVGKALEIIDKANYWKVLNDDDVCCTLAHEGVDSVINRMQGAVNAVLSRNG